MSDKYPKITGLPEIEAILRDASVCRIGLADGGEPYVVPVCFGYDNGAIYFHSGMDGKKISMIRNNPRCCFEVDLCDGILKGKSPCSWGVRYRSVIGYGQAAILTDPADKKYGLNCIRRQFQAGIHEFTDANVKKVAVIRITIESMTAKKGE